MIDTNWLSNLKKFDRERFDSLKRLNSENRKELAALYSFNLELANIAWNISEPELGYLKLRWWEDYICLLYTSPSPRDKRQSRMPSSA